jgi:hypothetical protein
VTLFLLHKQTSSTSSQLLTKAELEAVNTEAEYMLDKDDYKAAEEGESVQIISLVL